jgi:hypothetical protein
MNNGLFLALALLLAEPPAPSQQPVVPVVPVGVSPETPRYLWYGGRTRVFVGASADAACHFLPTESVPLLDMCNAGGKGPNDYRVLLPALHAEGLDKIRLWVALGRAKDAVNLPLIEGKKNQDYFDRLRAVVSTAQGLGMLVEVTFFAPFAGGAGGGQGGSPELFATDLGVRAAQKKIIEWTVEELWSFENVYWEIANEPEDQKTDPAAVAAWHEEMVATVASFDSPKRYPRLQRPHLIAAQPFTTLGGDRYIRNPGISILNGHYTQVADPPLDLGALQLVRRYPKAPKVLGFNEGKITPLRGTAAPRRHRNGAVDPEPSLDAARAEAWEFLLSGGGLLDHWGYLSERGEPRPLVGEIRRQLSVLQSFMNSLPLAKLETAASEEEEPPGWIKAGLDPYPAGTRGWDAATGSQRYWAALQTDAKAATGRLFLLYSHQSTRRCAQDADFTAAGCLGGFLPMGGYDARVWEAGSGKRYTASFAVDLGPQPGLFDVVWRRPADLQPLKQQTLAWRREACELPGCVVCPGPGADPAKDCTIALPEGYDFDVLLHIWQR